MIKDNELRIGNLIMFKSTGDVEKVRSVVVFDGGKTFVNDVNISDVEPIPITDIILIGSEFKRTRYMSGDKRYSLLNSIDGTSDFEVWFSDGDIAGCIDGEQCQWGELKYVHQLQNLYFSLTGINLCINQNVIGDSQK